ncbi:MAG: hypothetical protein GXP31_00050 [Kiritimatiellaeota bacterium]|nr:hypothetical protein [Kiritimatiellota bacterium]
MLALSILEWLVVVFSLRIAVMGNPVFTLLSRADPAAIERMDAMTAGPGPQSLPAAEDIRFLRTFMRWTLIELVLFLVEVGLLVYLLWTDILPLLCAILLGKDLAMVALSFYIARQQEGPGLFGALCRLPRWLIWTDRISALTSGAGFLVLFMAANGLIKPPGLN